MTRLRVALIGMGRMGQAIAQLAASHDVDVVARLDAVDVAADGLSAQSLADAEVAIDFTVPDAAVRNAAQCLVAGVPVVIGTTGWYDRVRELDLLCERHSGRVLWSPNFAPGVQLMLALTEVAGRLFRHAPQFAAHMVEMHHDAKLDAPSGTAIAMRDRATDTLGRDVPVTSVRVGSVPGTHTLIFDAPFEQVQLVHEARDRRVFADGALGAARWLASATAPGVYTMRDVLNLPNSLPPTP